MPPQRSGHKRMSNPVQETVKHLQRKKVPELRSGDVVRVHERVREGSKERVQVFEGLVLAVKHGKGFDGTFTVRKIGAGGVGVERIFPLHMPAVEKVEVLRHEHVRRAKLYYVRQQVGKKTKKRKAKIKDLIFDMGGAVEEAEDAEENQENNETEQQESTEASKEENQDAEEKSDEKEEQSKDSQQPKDDESAADKNKTEEGDGSQNKESAGPEEGPTEKEEK